jgi:pimeloyl-ACP methyl ester carboxylesterase
MPTRIDPRRVSERIFSVSQNGVKIPVSVFERPGGHPESSPTILILYGGDDKYTPNTRVPIKTTFVENGFRAASFPFRGHVPGGPDFYETGLWSRVEDARAVLAKLKAEYPKSPVAIFAVSMGGYVATFLQPELVAHLILVAPAAYHADAVRLKLNFDPPQAEGPFRALIRPTDNFSQSDGFKNIQGFSDSSLAVIGFTRDLVVKPEWRILERYFENHPNKRRTLAWLEFGHRGNFLYEKKVFSLVNITISHINHFSKS